MRISVLLAVCALGWGLTTPQVLAQRGVGGGAGVARQAIQVETASLKGKLVSVETGPCEKTTGRAPAGVHILLKVRRGEQLNVHLGPTTELQHVVDQLKVGQKLTVQAFRTEKTAKGHYVATSLKLGDETIQLRDEMRRPVWANNPPAGRGRGQGKFGPGGRCGQCPRAGQCARAQQGPAAGVCPCGGQCPNTKPCPKAKDCPKAGQCPNAATCPNAKQCPNAKKCPSAKGGPKAKQSPSAGQCPNAKTCPNAAKCPNAASCGRGGAGCGGCPTGIGLSDAAGDPDLPPLPKKKR
jgi:hypothetical protein